MCMLFEICEKTPFQKCMGWGGIGDHIFEYQGRTFQRFRVFGPQGAPLTRAVRDTNSQVFPWVLRHIVELEQSERTYRGGKNLVWENFCPEKFRRGKIPPQSLKVMGKIAPELAVRNFDTALTINWQLHVVGSLKCPEG